MSLEIKDYLKRLDLSDSEITVYLTLCSFGSSSVLSLSKNTNIKRSTIYLIIENLIKKGFVYKSISGNKKVFVSESPDKIKDILDQRIEKINNLKLGSEKIIKSIKHISKACLKCDSIDVVYRCGKRDVQKVYIKALTADSVLSFVNLDKYYELYPGTRSVFIEALNKNLKRTMKTIAVDTYLARQINRRSINPRYQSKFISEDFFDNVDIHIYEDSVSVIDLNTKKPSAVVMNSCIIANAFRGLHNLLWSVL